MSESSLESSPVTLDLTTTPTTLRLAGVVDVRAAAGLHQSARAAAERGVGVLVACSELERWDTSVLQVLLALERALAGRLALEDVPERPAAQLRFAGLERLLKKGSSQ